MRIYMDVCCFNRPQDDFSIGRNRLEAEAVLSVLHYVQQKIWVLVDSDVIDAELALSPSPERRTKAESLAAMRSSCVLLAAQHVLPARELALLGLTDMDALHVACAELDKYDVLLTTDDRLLARYRAHSQRIIVHIANPLVWIAEVTVPWN